MSRAREKVTSLALLMGAVFLPVPASAEPDAASDYAALVEGSWSSEAQSADPGFDWVESETVRVLSDRTDGVWLYQENAILADQQGRDAEPWAKDRPYFQVVIQLRALGRDAVHTTTYRLETAEARSGAKGVWRDPSRAFDPAWIGGVACMGEVWRIATDYWQGAAECPNTYKGGAKVDSRSIRTPDAYVNWDRGFDVSGQQLWGPVSGGYIFKRKGNSE